MEDLFLAAVGEIGKRSVIAAIAHEPAVDVVERALAAAIDEQVVDDRSELVAGRAGDRPLARQMFAGAEDLFDDDKTLRIADCGLRISDCGLLFIPQSAFRIPQ